MIQNLRQYSVTKRQIAKLEGAIAAAHAAANRMDGRVLDAMVAGIASQIAELRQELREFEDLREKDVLPVRSGKDLAQALIKARIARGYNQRELADKAGLQPQQIQRYEASGYSSASLKRISDLMAALEVRLEGGLFLTGDAGAPPGHWGEALPCRSKELPPSTSMSSKGGTKFVLDRTILRDGAGVDCEHTSRRLEECEAA